ncbi:MAG: thymidine phosphorylase [Bdellovibrionales bacterium]
MFFPAEIIKAKRNGLEHSEDEISFLIQKYTSGELPDYQMSAWLMAVYFKGLSQKETLALTQAMLNSGRVMSFPRTPEFKVDKHSTGGIGDKTSLILGPVVAALGIPVPMISGRGLGHTGGTLDKLESIPGFNTQLSLDRFEKMIFENKISFIGQTLDICPADKKIYALRDVTATVESRPLICASIMSKKLAEGVDGLVLDVKWGTGAFMKTLPDAENLALSLQAIAKGAGRKCTALLTDMNQPLGRFAGNALEVLECVEIMQNQKFLGPDGIDLYADTRHLSLALSAHMVLLAGQAKSYEEAYSLCEAQITSGAAYRKFQEMVRVQGGRLEELPSARNRRVVPAPQDGYVQSFNAEKVGIACIALHAGRLKKEDSIEPTSGVEFHKKIGHPIKKGEPLFTIYGANPDLFKSAEALLLESVGFSLQKPKAPDLIVKTFE